jgi:hypothetical protein
MKRHLLGLAVVGLVVAATGCAKDPTSSLKGTPTRIVASLSKAVLTEGDSVLVTAQVLDQQDVPLGITPDVASADPAMIAITDANRPPLNDARFYIKGLAAGAGAVTVSTGGVSTDIAVVVFPLTFGGTMSVATTGQLDTVTIAASSLIGFDDAATTVEIEGVHTQLISITSTEIKVLALNPAAVAGATVTLNDVVFLPGTADESPIGSIDAAATIDVTGEANEPGNNDPATATAMTVDGSVDGVLTSTDVDDFFVFTLTAAAALDITVTFNGAGADPDIDAYLLGPAPVNDNYCDLDGCAMGTGAQPEHTTTGVLAAGTYYLYINLYDAGDEAEPHWYRATIIKQ